MTTNNNEVLKTLRSRSLHSINQGNKRTHAFNTDFTDVNPAFTGVFQVHYPSQMERMEMGVIKSSLLGGNLQVDNMTENIAHVVSTLEVVLDTKPDWFDVFSPDLDYGVLESVYVEYVEWVNTFRTTDKQSNHKGDSPNAGGEVLVVGTKDVSSATNRQQV